MNEFERIETFVAQFERVAAPFGPGDDAAVLEGSCVTVDAVVENVHFTRPAFSLEDIGHKALAVNLSDLAAMGARPTWALCALGLPADFSDANLRALGRGMGELARVHGVSLIGGNVTSSPVLSVTVTVSGTLGKKPLLRSGAKLGDVVFVSGPLGLASAGLEVLTRKAEGFERLTAAQKRPVPHLAWARAAAGFASAGIDVSDGLLQDLAHLAKASKVAIDIDNLAVHVDLFKWSGSVEAARAHALTGGEDYVVAVTVPKTRVAAFEAAMTQAGFGAFEVGRVKRGSGVTVDGERGPAKRGFQHSMR